MSSGPEGQQLPSPRGRIYDGICSDSCVIQDPLTWQAGPYMTMPLAGQVSHSVVGGIVKHVRAQSHTSSLL
jgi:hypothetical protein